MGGARSPAALPGCGRVLRRHDRDASPARRGAGRYIRRGAAAISVDGHRADCGGAATGGRACARHGAAGISWRHACNVALQASREQRFIAIHVDDDGPGIAPEFREEVFRPFYRLDEARNQDHGGAGLGLAIARDIARSHGGDVSLGTSPMGGLRATVRIPL